LDHEAACLQRQRPRATAPRHAAGQWLQLGAYEHGRKARLRAAAAQRLAEVNAEMARLIERCALDRAMHDQPLAAGTVEDCITGAWSKCICAQSIQCTRKRPF
jgi:hypothetical protein